MGNSTDSKTLDLFYPASPELKKQCVGALLSMQIKLRQHMEEKNSSKLCNRLGQLRRNCPDFTSLPDSLQKEAKEAVAYLRAEGRKVNLGSNDPKEWITTPMGFSRWG